MQDDIVIPITGNIEVLKAVMSAVLKSIDAARMLYLESGEMYLYNEKNWEYNRNLDIYFQILEHEKLNEELKERI